MSEPEIRKVGISHDLIIDHILLTGVAHQGELARTFGYSETWMSIIINSDAFKERLAARKAELVDPEIRASLVERAEGAAKKALDKLIERLDKPGNLKTMELVSIAKLGIGDKTNRPSGPQPTTNNLYVLQIPQPAQNTQAWLEQTGKATPQGVPVVIENEPGGKPGFFDQ